MIPPAKQSPRGGRPRTVDMRDVLNTLSLMSLISRYRNERQHVYGEDIAHLDAIKAAQQANRTGVASR